MFILILLFQGNLQYPDNKEHAIGAIMEDGTYYLDDELISFLQITPQYLEDEKAFQLAEIKRRSMMYSFHLPTYKNSNKAFEDRLVILVDDGAATGSTLITVTRWLRKKRPNRLIIAVPVIFQRHSKTIGTRIRFGVHYYGAFFF